MMDLAVLLKERVLRRFRLAQLLRATQEISLVLRCIFSFTFMVQRPDQIINRLLKLAMKIDTVSLM